MTDDVIYRASRALCRMGLTIFFDYKAYGVNNVPDTGGCLMVSNHESYLDPILVGVNIHRIMSFMAKSELFSNRYFGWYITALHAFPVKQGRGDIGAVRETIDRLREGRILNIFPEGSRSKDGQLQPIQSGAALVIRRAEVPVVPAIIGGSFRSWPRKQKLPRLTRIRVLYGPPMYLHKLKPGEITRQINDRFHHMVAQLKQIIADEDRSWQLPNLMN